MTANRPTMNLAMKPKTMIERRNALAPPTSSEPQLKGCPVTDLAAFFLERDPPGPVADLSEEVQARKEALAWDEKQQRERHTVTLSRSALP
jgi:hypothetical protein